MSWLDAHTGGQTVPCQLCGKPAAMFGTRRCYSCRDLERLIRRDPQLALRIVLACLSNDIAQDVAAQLKSSELARQQANESS